MRCSRLRRRPLLPDGRCCSCMASQARSPAGSRSRALRAQGVTVDAINYLPFGTSVEVLADRLAVKVASLLSETGADKVHLVGHSLGGVVIAQAFADGRLTGQVDTVVTIAAPFGGSPWASLLPLGATQRALRDGSPLLRRLAASPLPDGVQWVAFTATLDVMVPGRRSVPAQAGVQTVTVSDIGHVGLLLSQQVVDRIVDALPIDRRAEHRHFGLLPAPVGGGQRVRPAGAGLADHHVHAVAGGGQLPDHGLLFGNNVRVRASSRSTARLSTMARPLSRDPRAVPITCCSMVSMSLVVCRAKDRAAPGRVSRRDNRSTGTTSGLSSKLSASCSTACTGAPPGSSPHQARSASRRSKTAAFAVSPSGPSRTAAARARTSWLAG
ncbi:MAG: triacylglycerol lipase [Actinomycetota bacterium]|nr:triacylglycerol lipase [Actinomycetota bacterium]